MVPLTSPRWKPLPIGFGTMLRTARLRAGLSRERLGVKLQASGGLVQGLEEGLRPPSVTVAGRLVEALALDPWEAALVHAVAVEEDALRTRLGTRHTRPRRPRNGSPTRASMVPTGA